MSLFKIAWRSIQRRGLASILTALSMALGVMLVVSVLLIHGTVERSFTNKSSLGYNMIVGAKGGRLQLVLNTVYYLSQPVENIPYAYYQQFLGADDIQAYANEIGMDQLGEESDGKFAKLISFAIPVCLGDYYDQFRVVGTIPQLFDQISYDADHGRKYRFDRGRNFQVYSDEHGYFECVVGAKVAREMAIELNATISATHGDPEGELHDEHPFAVVGILSSTGTPIDRAVFVNMEGFYLMDGHAKPLQEVEQRRMDGGSETGEDASLSSESNGPDDQANGPLGNSEHATGTSAKRFQPLGLKQREVTAIVVRTKSPLVTPGLQNVINEGPVAQAALPIAEIYSLFHNIVAPVQLVLLAITVLICVVSGVSILVSIYNSMNDRRHEIAVMRALGAARGTVMAVVLWESVFLSLGGGMIGWLTGHTIIGLASPMIEERTGVAIGFFDLAPALPGMGIPSEILLIPGLIFLAVIVGILPALSAYRTDVAKSLSSNP